MNNLSTIDHVEKMMKEYIQNNNIHFLYLIKNPCKSKFFIDDVDQFIDDETYGALFNENDLKPIINK
jgi:hypothetical protein